MGVFDNFPYTNFHDLNLDWILNKVKETDTSVDELSEQVDELSGDVQNLKIFSKIEADNQIIEADSDNATLELEAGTGINLTADPDNHLVRISATTGESDVWYADTVSVSGSVITAASVQQSINPFDLDVNGIIFLYMTETNLPAGALSLELDGATVKPMATDDYGSSLTRADIPPGNIYVLKYNGTHYVLQSSINIGVKDVVIYDVPMNAGTSIVNTNGVARLPMTGNDNWGVVKVERGTEPPEIGIVYISRMNGTTEDPVPVPATDYYNNTIRPSVLPLADHIDRGAMSAADKIKLDDMSVVYSESTSIAPGYTSGTVYFTSDTAPSDINDIWFDVMVFKKLTNAKGVTYYEPLYAGIDYDYLWYSSQITVTLKSAAADTVYVRLFGTYTPTP